MFSGIGALPEPATESHVVNRGTPVAPCRLSVKEEMSINESNQKQAFNDTPLYHVYHAPFEQ
jgi:hypothetical protein